MNSTIAVVMTSVNRERVATRTTGMFRKADILHVGCLDAPPIEKQPPIWAAGEEEEGRSWVVGWPASQPRPCDESSGPLRPRSAGFPCASKHRAAAPASSNCTVTVSRSASALSAATKAFSSFVLVDFAGSEAIELNEPSRTRIDKRAKVWVKRLCGDGGHHTARPNPEGDHAAICFKRPRPPASIPVRQVQAD